MPALLPTAEYYHPGGEACAEWKPPPCSRGRMLRAVRRQNARREHLNPALINWPVSCLLLFALCLFFRYLRPQESRLTCRDCQHDHRVGCLVSAEANQGGPVPAESGLVGRAPGSRAAVHDVAFSANGATALSAVDLTLGFGQRDILSGISTEVHRGTVTALIGPTGSGKTTLLRTFNRMNDKVSGYRHSGDVLLDGRSIWHPASS